MRLDDAKPQALQWHRHLEQSPPGHSRLWVIKILATTLGETGGDAVTMSWLGETTAAAKGTGYLVGTAIFGVIFVAAVLVQIKAKKFHPFLYWLTIVATTTVGTTLADYCRCDASATPAVRPYC